jgi:hypothetical protein
MLVTGFLLKVTFRIQRSSKMKMSLSVIYNDNTEIIIFIAVEFSCEKHIFISRIAILDTLI